MKIVLFCLGFIGLAAAAIDRKCDPSVTTASGLHAPTDVICPGDLIFEDNFDVFDHSKWQHEKTLGGGGNWEFQWYGNNRTNSFVDDGVLYIRPSLSADDFGEEFLMGGNLNIHGGGPADQCTNPQFLGCERQGAPDNILNPIKSARIRTANSFSFKYGRVEVRAKMPTGDWLWPAVWFMPQRDEYGTWPASGEIDLLESRGNEFMIQDGINIGTEQVGSTLHFGPRPNLNAWWYATYKLNSEPGNGFNLDFHRYQMSWRPEGFTFSLDDVDFLHIPASEGNSFWERGEFDDRSPGTENPWRFATPMAPFDQEFHMIINLAVGSTLFFPDDAENPGGKPWSNDSPPGQAATDFWNGREQWLPTWNLDVNNGYDASLKVDYVRIWAL